LPYTNFHSARLQDPGKFSTKAWRTTAGGTIYGTKKIPSSINIVWGKLKGKDKPSDPPIAQALRFPMSKYTVATAKKFLSDNKIKYILFEPGKKGIAGSVQMARNLLIYPKDIPLATQMEAFYSLRAALEKAVSYKWGKGAFVHDFSNKEVVIGFDSSIADRPLSSYESGEYEKSSYKFSGKGEITFSGPIVKVTKVIKFESLDDKSWEEMWKMEEMARSAMLAEKILSLRAKSVYELVKKQKK